MASAVTADRSAPGEERAAGPKRVAPWERLDAQIEWYERRSDFNKRWYMRLKVLQIITAAAIPVLAAAGLPAAAGGGLGALVVVLEGVQQLNQFHASWTQYRSTAETLKHEKYLWSANAGPYAAAADPDALLAEHVEGLVSQEHAVWASTRQDRASREAG